MYKDVRAIRVSELIGESQNGWRDAVQNAVNEASKNLNNITGVEITNFTADVENGQLVDFKATMKVAYTD
ncbi:dodecin family protein [Desulforamulus aquiferis]|uniref:Dodecin family protein n=1 Tax=Desulforamulus aquiferis TaxID=1397668 RepID=A0AAW7ZBG9_9FIRM|nr:dodecin family protein [Desulforamulus aquiferis]MDO7786441.1 dodecin family protein [Desulforamulus aquiferis]RYD02553.1 hypothetical protein N752_24810 [Desulforamulus aquiferis]